MSHVVTIQTRLHDPAAIAAACRRLGLDAPAEGTARLYGAAATGLLVRLPGWNYPAVVDPLTGTVQYDNYGGRWGEQRHLDRSCKPTLSRRPAWRRARRASPSASRRSKTAASASRSSRATEMTSPRRRIVRPPGAPPGPSPRQQQRHRTLAARLDKARADLRRWMAKLRRAFHAVEKQMQTINRVKRQLSQWEVLHGSRD